MLKPEDAPNDLVPVTEAIPNDLVAVPEPDTPTFVEDRNLTVSAPASFDARELDYSMKTQLDGMAKSGFWGMADLGGRQFQEGVAKGLAYFGLTIPKAVGALVKEQGEVMSLDDKAYEMALPPMLFDRGAREISRQVARNTQLDEKMTFYGQKLIDWNKGFVEKLNLKPADGQKFGFDIGSTSGSVAVSIGLGYLTKNPAVMAAVFGGLQKAAVYEEARATGMDPRNASNLSSAAGAAEGALEFIGTTVFFKAVKVDKLINRTLIRMAEESIQEGLQTYAEADILNMAGVRKDSLVSVLKDVAYSMMLGSIASAPVASAGGIFERTSVSKELRAIGLSEKASNRVADILIGSMEKKVGVDPELDLELRTIFEKEASQMNLSDEEQTQNANEVMKFFQEIQGPEATPTEKPAKSKLTPVKKQTFEQKLNKSMEEKLSKLQDKEDEMTVVQAQLEEVKTVADSLRGRVNVTKAAGLAKEEIKRIPLAFKTREGGLSVDEAKAELETRFPETMQSVSDVVSFLEFIDGKEKALKGKIKELQPKYIRRQELTVLKEKLQALKQGFREGKVAAREETKLVQEVALDLIKGSTLSTENKAKFMTALKNTQTQKDLVDFIDDFDRRASELELKEEVRETKDNITSILSGTKTKLKSGRPAGKFTPELQELFNMARSTMKLTKQQAQDKLVANLDKLQPGQMPSPEEAMENRLLLMMGGFDNKNLNELKDIEAELETLLEIGKKGAELRMLQKKERRKQLKEGAIRTIVGNKPADPKAVLHPMKQWMDQFTKGFGKSFSGWDNLMDILSQDDKTSKANQSVLSKNLSVALAEENEKAGMFEATELVVEDLKAAYGVTTEKALHGRLLENEIKENLGTFRGSNGKPVTLILSKAEAIHMWMKFQDPTLHETLRSPEGNNYSPAMEQALNNFLSAEDIGAAKAQLAFYQEFYHNINSVYSEHFGVNLPQNEAYSPISREVDKEPANAFLEEQKFRRSVNPGGTITRVKNLHPIRVESAQSVLNRHITEMNHFINWLDVITDINAVFGDAEIRKTIEAKFGRGMLRLIDQQIQHFTQGGIDRSETQDIIANAIRKNYSLSVLALKPKIGLLQVTGALAFAADIPTAAYVGGIMDFMADTKTKMQILAETPFMKDRRGGVDRDIKDILNSKFFTDLATSYNNPATRALAKNQLSFKKALLMFNEMGDQAANYIGGWAAYKYAYDKSTQTDPDLRKQEALKFFTDTASKTQQSGDLSQQSSWQRGGGVLRLLTMFQSAQNQYFREEVGAIRNLLAGRMGAKEAGKKIFIYHVLLPQLAQLLANLGRWDDEAQRDHLRALIFGSLNGMFVLNDIMLAVSRMVMGDSRFGDEAVRIAPLSTLKGISRAWKELDHDEILFEDVLDASRELSSRTLGPALGLPIQQLFNYYDGVYDILEGEYLKGGAKLAGWPPFIVNKKFDEGE